MQLKVNSRYFDHIGEVKIMAIVDKYLMVRRSRCIPFVVAECEFRERFKEEPHDN